MFIFTEGITKALKEGYELTFQAAQNMGPNVIEMNIRKDDRRLRHFFDITKMEDTDQFEQYVDHVIRYAILYEFPNALKGE